MRELKSTRVRGTLEVPSSPRRYEHRKERLAEANKGDPQTSDTDEESLQREDEKDQAQPGPSAADELSRKMDEQVFGDTACQPRKKDEQVGEKLPRRQVHEENQTQIDSAERHPGGALVTSQV